MNEWINPSINQSVNASSSPATQCSLLIGCPMNKCRGGVLSDSVMALHTRQNIKKALDHKYSWIFQVTIPQPPSSFQLAAAPFPNNKAKPRAAFRSRVSLFPAAFVKALAAEYLMSHIWLNDETSYCYSKTDAVQSAPCHSFQLTRMDKCLLNTSFLLKKKKSSQHSWCPRSCLSNHLAIEWAWP